MELPITVVFEPPSPRELRALLRRRWLWLVAALLALSVGISIAVVSASRAEALATAALVLLDVRSRPAGAHVVLDGRPVGRTPASVAVAPGSHRVQLSAPDVVDDQYTIEAGMPGTALDAVLWRRQPALTRLRPTIPGSSLVDTRLAPDGSIVLVLALGRPAELQAWRLDASASSPELLIAGIAGARLTVAPDNLRVAFLGRAVGPIQQFGLAGSAAERVVWTARTHDPVSAPRATWEAPVGESLLDVAWMPAAGRLLAVSTQELLGGARRTRLWSVDSDSGAADLLLSLPSTVVPGAYAWSPDGRRLAFIAHAGVLNALCVLEADGELRYVADLAPSDVQPLPYPPVAWSPDSQRLLFVAPPQQPGSTSGGWFQPLPSRAVYVLEPGSPSSRLLTAVDAELPAWRPDGQLLLLVRGRDGGLSLTAQDLAGNSQRLVLLSLPSNSAYAGAWDRGQGTLLLASRNGSDIERWLVRLAAADAAEAMP